MASSKHSLGGADWMDVAAVIGAFEAINNCRLEVRITAADRRGMMDLALTVVASEREAESGVPPVLASQSVTCSGTNRGTLEAVVILALYGLDAQLASNEFTKAMSG